MAQPIEAQLLEKPTFTEAQLKGSVGEARTQSNAGPLFDFSLRLPRDWAVSFYPDAVPEPGQPPALMMHASPESNRQVEVRIWCAILIREMNPVDWLERWLQQTDHGIIDAKNFATPYGVLGDVLSHNLDTDIPGTRRALTIKDGNRLFLLETAAQRDEPGVVELMQNAFLVAAATFKLTSPTQERFAEPFEEFTTGGALPLTMIVPSSWTRQDQSKTPDDGDAITFDNDGFGAIMLATMPGCDNSEMLEGVLRGTLEANGVKIPEPDKSKIVVPSEFMNIIAGSDRATQGGETELLIMSARAETPEVSAAILLLTPSEESNPDAMAVNRRAYQILLESLRPAS